MEEADGSDLGGRRSGIYSRAGSRCSRKVASRKEGARGDHGFPHARPPEGARDRHRAPTTTLKKGFVGQSIPRKEDRRLVQGQGAVRRRHPAPRDGLRAFRPLALHAEKIVSIDVSAALALDGVYGTITGDEVAIQTDPFFEMSVEPGGNIEDYALAVGSVRHMGEPVAEVWAATRELARTRPSSSRSSTSRFQSWSTPRSR